MMFFFQRGEIIYALAELLTEKKDEILSANRKDMELATASGTEAQRVGFLSRNFINFLANCSNASFPISYYFYWLL